MADGYRWYDLRRVDGHLPDGAQTTVGAGLLITPNRGLSLATVTDNDLPVLLPFDEALNHSAHIQRLIHRYMKGTGLL